LWGCHYRDANGRELNGGGNKVLISPRGGGWGRRGMLAQLSSEAGGKLCEASVGQSRSRVGRGNRPRLCPSRYNKKTEGK